MGGRRGVFYQVKGLIESESFGVYVLIKGIKRLGWYSSLVYIAQRRS